MNPKPDKPTGRRRRPYWVFALLAIAVGLGAVAADSAVTTYLTRDDVRTAVEKFFIIPAALSIYAFLLAILAGFANWRRLFVGFLTPVLLDAGVVHLLKFLVGRARPRLGLGPSVFRPWDFLPNYDSFPSASSAAALVVALLLGMYFPRWRYVFYFMAGMVGLERILHSWHFLSDVLAGYAIAALIVYACFRVLGPRYYRLELDVPRSADS